MENKDIYIDKSKSKSNSETISKTSISTFSCKFKLSSFYILYLLPSFITGSQTHLNIQNKLQDEVTCMNFLHNHSISFLFFQNLSTLNYSCTTFIMSQSRFQAFKHVLIFPSTFNTSNVCTFYFTFYINYKFQLAMFSILVCKSFIA